MGSGQGGATTEREKLLVDIQGDMTVLGLGKGKE
jgi:hypothetical protein